MFNYFTTHPPQDCGFNRKGLTLQLPFKIEIPHSDKGVAFGDAAVLAQGILKTLSTARIVRTAALTGTQPASGADSISVTTLQGLTMHN